MTIAIVRHAEWLVPGWQRADADALMTTRHGGASRAPFDSMNLRAGQGDEPQAVARNQAILAHAMGVPPVYLDQVHGRAVVRLTAADARPGAATHRADASITTDPAVACAVQVADCLPVLFTAAAGRAVGAAHAGWRGLSAGVLEATVAALCEAASCEPSDVQAWLGPCIGPNKFEVGPDVLEAFGVSAGAVALPRFTVSHPGKWLADLPALARDRLASAGLQAITGGSWCTVSEPSRFFSYRRDRVTGRMAAAIRILPATI